MKILTGKVAAGTGDFGYWINKLHSFYQQKTGLNLFSGTLNIMLDEPYDLPVGSLRLEKEEYGGAVSVSIQPCTIFERKAFILRTDKNASGEGVHPTTIIEIATDVKLRDEYGLEDGDIVSVKVDYFDMDFLERL